MLGDSEKSFLIEWNLAFSYIFTGRNEVVAKVIFWYLFVILFTGGLPQCMLGYHPPGSMHPLLGSTHPLPGSTHPSGSTPLREAHIPPRPRKHSSPPPGSTHSPRKHAPPGKHAPPRSRLWQTVNERPVCIVLECILVPWYYQWHPTTFCQVRSDTLLQTMVYDCITMHPLGTWHESDDHSAHLCKQCKWQFNAHSYLFSYLALGLAFPSKNFGFASLFLTSILVPVTRLNLLLLIFSWLEEIKTSKKQ